MGTSLTGVNISASYLGLLKSTDSLAISSTAKTITDGAGNDLPIKLSTSQMLFGTGSASVPALSFNGNTSEGFYIPTDENIGVTIAGSEVARLNSSGFGVIDGTSSAPSLFFTGDTDTGLYRTGSGVLGITSNGTLSGEVTLTGFRAKKNSTASAPNYTFIGDDNTGLHSLDADRLDFILGGNRAFGMFYSTGVSTFETLSTDEMAFEVGSSERLRILNTGQIKLNTYGSGTITGTATQRLGVDSSGNVIEIPIGAGAVDGSGTANTVTMWSDTDTITDAPITISGNDSTFAGVVTIGSTTGISASTKLAVSDTNGAGLEVIPQTSNDRVTLLSYDRNASTYQTLDTDSSDVHFNINGSEKMRLDSSGRLGIATTDIEETVTIAKHDGGDGTIMGLRSDASFSQFEIATKNSQADWGLQTIGARNMYFSTNGSERMRISSDGKVSVGSPIVGQLGVRGTTDDSSAFSFESANSSGNTLFAVRNDGLSYFATGNVGVGIVPTRDFHLHRSTLPDIHITNDDSGSTSTDGATLTLDALDFLIQNREAGNIRFNVNGSERMRLDSGGRLLINQTSNVDSTPLQVTAPSGFSVVSGFISPETTSSIQFKASGTTANYKVRVGAIADDLVLISGGSTTMTLDDSQNAIFENTLRTKDTIRIFKTGQTSQNTYSASAGLQLHSQQSVSGSPYTKTSDIVANADGTVQSELRLFTKGNGDSTPSERMRIDSSGSVGISTTSISANSSLDIFGINGAKVRIATFTDQNADDPTIAIANGKQTRPSISFSTDNTTGIFGGSGFIALGTSANERMRITSGGAVLVGTTSTTPGFGTGTGVSLDPSSNNHFSVNASASIIANRTTSDGDILQVRKDGTTIGALGSNTVGGQPLLDVSANSTNGNMRFLTAGSERMRILSSGEIKFSGTSNTMVVCMNTADGADNEQLSLAGGGADSDGRGARMRLYGNEHASNAGQVDLSTGNIAGCDMFLRAKDTMQLYTGNSERMRIDSSGKVGIGKIPSTWAFDVDTGLIYIASFDGANNTGVVINSNNATASQILGFSNSASTYNDLDIRANATAGSGIYIDGSNNAVGIGTTSPDVAGFPSSTLTIEGSSTNYGAFELGSASQTTSDGRLGEIRFYNKESANPYGFASIRGLRGSSAGDSIISFFTSSSNIGAERMRITNTALIWKSNDIDLNNGTVLHRITNNDTNLLIRADYGNASANSTIQFHVDADEKARITSGGNLCVNTTDSTPNGLTIGSAIVGYNDGSMFAGHFATSTTGSSTALCFSNPNGQVGSVTTSGSATAYNTSSDYRLKEDLQDFNALNIASKIKMYDFKWKADDSRSYGVMAHELEEVLPQAVTGEKDAEEMQSVDYSKLVPILLKSIQELEARVKELEKEI